MADEENNEEQPKKGGYTVAEIEGKMKRYGLEITLTTIFALTCIFTLVFGGAWLTWSIILSMVLAIVGTLAPQQIHNVLHSALHFICKDKTTCIISAVVGILFSIFLPFVALIGKNW